MFAGPGRIVARTNLGIELQSRKKGREKGGFPLALVVVRAYRSATIALSAVLSHQNIKGGARSRRCIDFPLPFLSPVSSFFFIRHPSPSLPLHCGDVFLHAAREEGGRKGFHHRLIAPRYSADRFRIPPPPLPAAISRGAKGSTFDRAAAWISLMNSKSDRRGGFLWNGTVG